MKFKETEIVGCFIIEPEARGDHRGFFARLFDTEAFSARGLEERFVQFNNSLSIEAGTLRGLHYQVAPAGEVKLVRCVAGAIYDVVVDMRADSPSFLRWTGAELTAQDRLMMYVPKGCAHGFLTLTAHTELVYFASSPYSGESERVLRWNDPCLGIIWPGDPAVLSDKDRDAPDYHPDWHRSGY
ncbi:MAG TPA: dTDP-4-dehydrorhamnose 3,5-epimerase [Devosiaceae bacterium]|nr:dTDP-4-dehydrorhamnose 3,5-epimerase [Devosiaceae bacterium]